MKLKLLLILTEFPPKFGGMQTHAEAICARLEQDYDLSIFTYKATKDKEEAVEFDRGVQYTVHRVLSRVSFFYNIRKLRKALIDKKPILIYSSTIFYGYLGHYTKIPIVCRSVGNDILRPWIIYPFQWGSTILGNTIFENLFNLMKKKLYKPPNLDYFFAKRRRKLSLECAQGAQCILANSNYTKAIFDEKKITQCRVLVGGVSVEKFKRPQTLDQQKLRRELGIDSNKFLMITACRFVKKKGIDFLIEAFQCLENTYPDLELLIIGDGPMRKMLRRKANSPNIHFVGKKMQSEIIKYYWAADLFVLCSREVINPLTGFKDVETMGRVLCEANAAGIPILASDTGGVSSVVENGHNGLLYKTDNLNSFLTNFSELYKNPLLIEKLISNGIQRAEAEFSWSILLKEHRKLFKTLIKKQTLN